MRIQLFTAILSSMLALSLAHAEPSVLAADDRAPNMATPPAAIDNTAPATPAVTENNTVQGSVTPPASPVPPPAPSDNANANDDMSADTATGDDDY